MDYGIKNRCDMFSYGAVFRENDTLWISNGLCNALYKKDLVSGSMQFVCCFPKERKWVGQLHRKIFGYQGQLFFIPLNGKYISVYHIQTGKWDSIECCGMGKIADAVSEGSRVWIFPQMMDGCMGCLCMETKTLILDNRYSLFIQHSIKPHVKKGHLIILREDGVCKVRNRIYMAYRGTNIYGIFDVEKGTFEAHEINGDIQLWGICELDGCLAMSLIKNPCIYVEDGSSHYFIENDGIDGQCLVPYEKLVSAQGRLYGISCEFERFFEVDLSNRKITVIGKFQALWTNDYFAYLSVYFYKDLTILEPLAGKHRILIDRDGVRIEESDEDYLYQKKNRKFILNGLIDAKDILSETKDLGLLEFLYCLENKEDCSISV